MSNKLTAQQLLDEVGKAAGGLGNGIAGEFRRGFQVIEGGVKGVGEEVKRNFSVIDGGIKDVKKVADDVGKAVGSEQTKSFLKDPVGKGKNIVTDAIKQTDSFFAKIFKGLATDVGKIFQDKMGGFVNKVGKAFDGVLKTAVRQLSRAFETVGKTLERSTNKIAQGLGKEFGKIGGQLGKVLKDWGKASGLAKAISDIGKMLGSMKDQSKALSAFKDLGRAASSILTVVKTLLKFLPLISELFNMKFRNDVINGLTDLKRSQKLNETIQDKQFQAIFRKIAALESTIKKGDETQKLSAEVASVKSAVQGLGPKIDTGFSGINRGLSPIPQILSKLSATTQKDYSGQLSQIQSSLGQLNSKSLDYQQITSATTAALSAWKPGITIPADLARKSDLSSLATKADLVKPDAINYGKINEGVTSALKAAELRIPDDVARKSDLNVLVKRSDMEALTKVQNDLNRIDYTKVSSSVRDALTNYKPKIELPPEVARRSDIDEIKRIPNLITDLNPVLSQLSNLGSQISKVDAKIAPTNLNSLQSQLNNLQSAIANNINAGTNAVTSTVTNMGNTLQSFITNNNTTIINQLGQGINLNPASIIDPLKQHINTSVAQPLSKTMEVLNVNDLARGISMNAENVIKASGLQQFGTSGTATATNLVSLTAMMAAPLFMRAGFQRLGGSFDVSVMDPTKGKVQINDALAASMWTFRQMDERMGLPTKHAMVNAAGQSQSLQYRSMQDTIENVNAQTIAQGQDLEVIERYQYAMAQDLLKMMQIVLQLKDDVELLVADAGCKFEEIKKSHPTHLNVKAPGTPSNLLQLFTQGRVHYVGREWKDNADKRQILERIGLDTQIAAMSNKFEIKDPQNVDLPLDKSTARKGKAAEDETWKIFVSTMEEPPEIYGVKGNPIPEIKEIRTGTVKEVQKPTNPNKKLGQ